VEGEKGARKGRDFYFSFLTVDISVTSDADLAEKTVHMCLFLCFAFYDVFCAAEPFT